MTSTVFRDDSKESKRQHRRRKKVKCGKISREGKEK